MKWSDDVGREYIKRGGVKNSLRELKSPQLQQYMQLEPTALPDLLHDLRTALFDIQHFLLTEFKGLVAGRLAAMRILPDPEELRTVHVRSPTTRAFSFFRFI